MRSLIRPLALAVVALMLLAGLWLWQGGMDGLARWAADAQREVQNGMARALRALRGGDPGALAALMSVCFAYGFFHAVGPGHGKLLVGGYGVAEKVPLGRLTFVALAGSLAQAVTAIALVAGGIWLLGLTRAQLTETGDAWLAPVSLAAIALVGVWLALRGARRLWAQLRTPTQVHDHAHHTHHDHAHTGPGETCATCGHAHGPDPQAVARASGWRAHVALIAAMGVRPCTGALFLLILGWGMGLQGAAIAGTLAMALGTATVTVAVAAGAVLFRESLAQGLGDGRRAGWIASGIEITAGLLVCLVATSLLLRVI